MTIFLFKVSYPSGYTRYALTLNEAIRLINGRSKIKLNWDKIIKT